MVSEARRQKIKAVMAKRRSDLTVVLEDLYDPHNAAAIWRTCDAYGVGMVNLIFAKQTPYDPKKLGKSSSATANKWLNFRTFHNTRTCLQELKAQEFKIVATVLDQQAQNIYEFTWPKKVALLVGNEHAGLSQEAISLSDAKVYIPMQGMVQSLNVSVATAIFLSEAYRNYSDKSFKFFR